MHKQFTWNCICWANCRLKPCSDDKLDTQVQLRRLTSSSTLRVSIVSTDLGPSHASLKTPAFTITLFRHNLTLPNAKIEIRAFALSPTDHLKLTDSKIFISRNSFFFSRNIGAIILSVYLSWLSGSESVPSVTELISEKWLLEICRIHKLLVMGHNVSFWPNSNELQRLCVVLQLSHYGALSQARSGYFKVHCQNEKSYPA